MLCMRVGLLEFSEESVNWFREAVAETQALMAERESPGNQAMAMTPTRVVTVCDREEDI